MNKLMNFLSCVFGYVFLALALLIGTETLGRKWFSFSLSGTDELSGYILAFASCLAFVAGIAGKTHIRIDIFFGKLPAKLQAILNWLSATFLFACGGFMAWAAYFILDDSIEYGSTAATPWATPLVWPQGFWFAGLLLFSLAAAVPFLKATGCLLRGDLKRLYGGEFSPPRAKEEVEQELEDLKRRRGEA